MWCLTVAGVADTANLITAPNPIAGLDSYAPSLHMRIKRIGSASHIQDCEVAVGFIDGKALRKLAGHLVAEIIARGDHDRVGHG
jgi:hypothetical protein